MTEISLELPLPQPAPEKRRIFIHHDGTRQEWNGDPSTIGLRSARARNDARDCSILIRPDNGAVIMDGFTV